MGRAERVSKSKRIKLEKAEFFELKSAIGQRKIVYLEAVEKSKKVAAQYVQKQTAEAAANVDALVKALGGKYKFDPTVNYALDERTMELVPPSR